MDSGLPASPIARDISTIRHLSWKERALLVEAATLLPVIALALRVVTFQRLYQTLTRWTPASRPQSLSSTREVVDRAVRIVGMAANRSVPPSSCLHRSLALWWLLRRRGVSGDLRFGARRRNDELEAHAWVEIDGVVVNDDPMTIRDYAVLPWIVADPNT